MKAKYYFMHCIEDEAFGVGYAPPEYGFDLLKEGQSQECWEPVAFLLRDGGYADYQANDLGWPLCSDRLRLVIDTYAASHDIRQWLPATVMHPGGEVRQYHILHLPERPDVLDKGRTIYAGKDVVVKPHLSAQAASAHHVFSFRGGEFGIIVSARVRDAILSARCTGLDFFQVPST